MVVYNNLKAPLISVVIPLYNKEKWISRTLNSVLKQTFKNIEIVIINDGSTDNSVNIVNEFDDKRIKLFTNKNNGLSHARNYGIEKSVGEFIALVDADDEWRENHLEVLLKGFNLSDDVILVCDDIVEVFDESDVITRRKQLNSLSANNKINYNIIENYFETLEKGFFILSSSSVLIKSDIIKNYNILFQKDAEPSEDVNYWIMLQRYGKFVYCDYLGAYYHRADEQSIMNKKSDISLTIPPFFHKIDISIYNSKELLSIRNFLKKEYLKKAFQNRGLKLRKEELKIDYFGINLGIISFFSYIFIRFCPSFLFNLLKNMRKRLANE